MKILRTKFAKKAFSLLEISVVVLIIGIMMAGVAESGKMLQKFRLHAARALTEGSPVTGTKSLLAWWDSTSERSYKLHEDVDGGKISIWYDLKQVSVEKYDVTQPHPENQPTYVQEAINNLPALKFDGASTYLEIPFDRNLNPENITIFAVMKTVKASTYGAILSSRNDPPYEGYTLYATPTVLYQMWIGDGSGSWGETGTPSVPIVFGQTDVVSATHDSTTLNFYNRGAVVGDGSVERPMWRNLSNPLRIGAGKNESLNPDFFYNGYIGEIIIYDRVLPVEQRKAIEAYLGKKWWVPIS